MISKAAKNCTLFHLRLFLIVFSVWIVLCNPRGTYGQAKKTPVGATLSGKLAFPSGFMRSVKEYGAVGDGVADDTASIQAALADGRSNSAAEYNGAPKGLYFPPGVYLVHDTLSWNGCCVTLQGAGPSASVIRLAPASDGFNSPAAPKPLLLTPAGNSSFRENIWDLGFSVGAGNAGASVLDYVSNNNGSIHNVSIVSEDGQGVAGIVLTRHYPGPLMIKNVSIRGFQTGIVTAAYEYGATLESITLEGQTVAGIQNVQQPIYIRGLKSINSVPALINNGGFAVLIGARLIGNPGATYGILNNSELYLREVSSTLYRAALLDSRLGSPKEVRGTIDEYLSDTEQTFTGSPDSLSLRLPVSETPSFRDGKVANWKGFVPDFYGDTHALQNLFSDGASTVYFPFGPYLAYNEAVVTVPDNIQRIIGFSSVINGSPYGANGGGIRFVVNGDSNTPLVIEQFGYGIKVEHRGKRPVVIKDGNYTYSTSPGAGAVYFEDVQIGQLNIQPGQSVWARQLNNEFEGTKINNGGSLWVLGLKTERSGTVVNSTENAQTEIVGGLVYPAVIMPSDAVAFSSTNARVSYIYAQPVYCAGCGYATQVLQENGSSYYQIQSNPSARYVMPLFHSH